LAGRVEADASDAGVAFWLGREPTWVTDLAEDDRCDDRADPVEVDQLGARRGDSGADAILDGGDVAAEVPHVGQEVLPETLALRIDGRGRVDAAQQRSGSISP
jgi:hypothetical protein